LKIRAQAIKRCKSGSGFCSCKNKCFFAMDKYSLLTGAF
jgi:hypothetical protein